MADLVGEVLDPIIQEADGEDQTEVIRTEELCHEIGKTKPNLFNW